MHAFRNCKLFLVEELCAPIVNSAAVMTRSQSFGEAAGKRALESSLHVDHHVVVCRAQPFQQRLRFSALESLDPILSPATQCGGKDVRYVRMPGGHLGKRFVYYPI